MSKEKEKILIVDDEPDIVDALKHFVLTKGYEVIGAFSGEEALRILEKERVDLILLDFKLPGLKGTDIARIVKDKYPSIKLIVITAHPEEIKESNADNLLQDLLVKPLNIQELYKKILDVLYQDESHILELKPKQEIRARVLLIKAKLLFLEPSGDIYNTLKQHFLGLIGRGETYELDLACNTQEVIEKLKQSVPDMLILNMAYLDSLDRYFTENISQCPNKPKEIIIYKISPSGILEEKELERLSKAVQAISLKNGLIEIKWVKL